MGRFNEVELDDVELRGERVVLRRWRPADASDLHAIMRDRSMYEFLTQLPDPYTLEAAREYVTTRGHEGRDSGTGIGCAVVEAATDRLVGSIALRLNSAPGGSEIGYWIAPAARGNGYAAEATRLLADWAFAHDLPRVWVMCDVRNLGSVRTALAGGFRFEGVARDAAPRATPLTGPPHDLARFARLAGDPAGEVPSAFPPLPAGGLGDGVVTLRTMRSDDAQALAETDDELTLRWGFSAEAHSPDEVRRAADRAGLDWLVGAVAAFSIVDTATGRVAGSLRLRKQGPPQVGGIGYVVHPAFRGRGYSTRALRLLVPWAFDVADFARLELGAKVGNEASLRAAASAGFEPDGVRIKRLRNPDGTFADEGRYALNNPKYA